MIYNGDHVVLTIAEAYTLGILNREQVEECQSRKFLDADLEESYKKGLDELGRKD